MTWKSKLVRLLPGQGLTADDVDRRLEATAARIEQHTVNLAEHQAQLRDETIRQIVNEVRANSAFLADSTIAMDRINARRADLTHAAVRPLVHTVRATVVAGAPVIVVDHVDPILVDELVTDGHAVTVVEPAVDYPLPPEVVIAAVAITRFRGPHDPVPLVVWVARAAPEAAAIAAVRGWIATGGSCVVACPVAMTEPAGFMCAETRAFRRTDAGRFARITGTVDGAGDLYVYHLVAR